MQTYTVRRGDSLSRIATAMWMIYPISGKTGVLLTYVSEHIPPQHAKSSVGSVGFSLTLQ